MRVNVCRSTPCQASRTCTQDAHCCARQETSRAHATVYRQTLLRYFVHARKNVTAAQADGSVLDSSKRWNQSRSRTCVALGAPAHPRATPARNNFPKRSENKPNGTFMTHQFSKSSRPTNPWAWPQITPWITLSYDVLGQTTSSLSSYCDFGRRGEGAVMLENASDSGTLQP